MRQSAVTILRRWMDLDKQLRRAGFGEGVRLSEFAAKWGVDVKTVRRDLKAFEELGYGATRSVYDSGEGDDHRWHYRKGQRPMFDASFIRPAK